MALPQFERIARRGPILIDYLDGPGPDLVISFSSIGHDAGRAPSPEFVATATGRGTAHPRRALFVRDESRSWGNDPGFDPALLAALAEVNRRAPVGRMGAVGLSMGGFAALVAAQIIPLHVVLAFGPQWSVSPDIIPAETRWQDWTQRLPPLVWPHAPMPTPARTWAIILHGALDDHGQARQFPLQTGTDHLLFPGLGHGSLMAHLKARGSLAGLMEAAMAGDRRRLLRIASSAGGIRRRSIDVPPA